MKLLLSITEKYIILLVALYMPVPYPNGDPPPLPTPPSSPDINATNLPTRKAPNSVPL